MMTDTAAYEQPSGILRAVDLVKCATMPSLSAAVACTGPALLGGFFADRLPSEFRSFDDLVTRGAYRISELFQDYADENRGGDAFSSIYLIGWHKGAGRPGAYAMDCWTETSSRIAQVLENSTEAGQGPAARFKLVEQELAGTPIPAPALLAAAGWSVPADTNDLDPARDFLALMQIQRAEEIEGRHWVGGAAMLTTITRYGITQRTVHRWPGDTVGEPIKPRDVVDDRKRKAAR